MEQIQTTSNVFDEIALIRCKYIDLCYIWLKSVLSAQWLFGVLHDDSLSHRDINNIYVSDSTLIKTMLYSIFIVIYMLVSV